MLNETKLKVLTKIGQREEHTLEIEILETSLTWIREKPRRSANNAVSNETLHFLCTVLEGLPFYSFWTQSQRDKASQANATSRVSRSRFR